MKLDRDGHPLMEALVASVSTEALNENWKQRTRKGKPVDAWTNLTAFVFKGDSNQHTVVPKGVTRTAAEALALEGCRPIESLPWTPLPSIPKPKR